MRKILILIIIALVVPVCASANDQIIDDFAASSQGQSVILEWRSSVETDVAAYNVQRSFDGTRFYTVATLDPEGAGNLYQHIDDDLYKQRLDTYYYRIEAEKTPGQKEFSRTEAVTISFSEIRRSWGSIKALFR